MHCCTFQGVWPGRGQLDTAALTEQIDDALLRLDHQSPDESVVDAVAIGRQVVSAADDDW